MFIFCPSLCRTAETRRHSQMVAVYIRKCIEGSKKEKKKVGGGRHKGRNFSEVYFICRIGFLEGGGGDKILVTI